MRFCPNIDPAKAVRSNLAREMAVYDALPECIRQVVQEGPENLSLLDCARALVDGAPVAVVRNFLKAEIAEVYRQADRRIRTGEPPPRRERSVGP